MAPSIGRWRIPLLAVAAALLVATGCQNERANLPLTPTQPAPAAPVRVLMLTATLGYRHDSIVRARDVMGSLATSSQAFTLTVTEDVRALSAQALQAYDVLCFALTSGELPFTTEQKTAILDFVRGGKGFLGVHSATDTLYEWPEYGQLVGAYFLEHPWTEEARVVVEDAAHPATTGLGAGFVIREEFYAFRDNPRPRVRTLLRLDAASVGATGDYPLAWSQELGSGRSYYNALGHFPETWTDTRFQQQLIGAIRWLGRIP